ncbi:hypothetical protein SDJN03_27836, partial [Cucurbita argyrosperma subsp. sororia]
MNNSALRSIESSSSLNSLQSNASEPRPSMAGKPTSPSFSPPKLPMHLGKQHRIDTTTAEATAAASVTTKQRSGGGRELELEKLKFLGRRRFLEEKELWEDGFFHFSKKDGNFEEIKELLGNGLPFGLHFSCFNSNGLIAMGVLKSGGRTEECEPSWKRWRWSVGVWSY